MSSSSGTMEATRPLRDWRRYRITRHVMARRKQESTSFTSILLIILDDIRHVLILDVRGARALHSYPISLDKIASMTLVSIAAYDATTHRLQAEG